MNRPNEGNSHNCFRLLFLLQFLFLLWIFGCDSIFVFTWNLNQQSVKRVNTSHERKKKKQMKWKQLNSQPLVWKIFTVKIKTIKSRFNLDEPRIWRWFFPYFNGDWRLIDIWLHIALVLKKKKTETSYRHVLACLSVWCVSFQFYWDYSSIWFSFVFIHNQHHYFLFLGLNGFFVRSFLDYNRHIHFRAWNADPWSWEIWFGFSTCHNAQFLIFYEKEPAHVEP